MNAPKSGLLEKKTRRGAQFTVLVVDDELDVLLPLVELLSDALPEARIYPAASPKEALDFAAHLYVDLVITDYRMPGMTGEDLLGFFNSTKSKPSSILMTAYPSEGLTYRTLQAGVAALLFTKPFDGRVMATMARQALAARSTAGEAAVPASPVRVS